MEPSESIASEESTVESPQEESVKGEAVIQMPDPETERGDGVASTEPEQTERKVESDLPGLSMRSDQPLDGDEGDVLGFTVYADALSRVIQHSETETPFVLAINARWGGGKSSLGRMLRYRLTRLRKLEGRRPYVVCEFNPWMHDDAVSLRTSLAAAVARAADEARPFILRRVRPISSVFLSGGKRLAIFLPVYIAAMLAIWGVLLCWNYLDEDGYRAALNSVSGFLRGMTRGQNVSQTQTVTSSALAAVLSLIATLTSKLGTVGRAVSKFVSNPTEASNKGGLDEVRNQLGTLIKEAIPYSDQRFVIFVDDIERCSPPKPIEVLESVNQLINHRGVIVILLGDMPAIAANAGLKYKDIAKVYNPDNLRIDEESAAMRLYGYRYMQKIVQLQFDIPSNVAIPCSALMEAEQVQREEWIRNAARDAARIRRSSAKAEEQATAQATLLTSIAQPFFAAKAALNEAGDTKKESVVAALRTARTLYVALAVLQACGFALLLTVAATYGSSSDYLQHHRFRFLWAGVFLILASPLAAIAYRAARDEKYRASFIAATKRVPYAVFKLLAPTFAFSYEQSRLPRRVFEGSSKVWLFLLTVAQLALAVMFALGLVVFVMEWNDGSDTFIPGRFVAWGSLVTSWLWTGALGWMIKRAFESVVRRHLEEKIADFANTPDAFGMDFETAKERIVEALERLNPGLSDRQQQGLRSAVDRSGSFFGFFFRRKTQERIIGNNAEIGEALAAGLPHLPPLPRNAVRLTNIVRLMVYVLRVRDLLPRAVSPATVGKWSALSEGWPDVADRLLRDPRLMRDIEPNGSPTDENSVQRVIAREFTEHQFDDRLRRLLASPNSLSHVVACLAKQAI